VAVSLWVRDTQGQSRTDRGTEGHTYKLEELVNVEVSLWVDGRLKQRQKHVTEQLLETVDHLVFTIHIAGQTPSKAALQ